MIDWYGLPKHAYYTVRQSMAMLDVSLSYSDIHAAPGKQLPATVWVDSELADARQCAVEVQYFTPHGEGLGTERIAAVRGTAGAAGGFQVLPAAATKLGQLTFVPPAHLDGNVVIVRLSLLCTSAQSGGSHSDVLAATNDYVFGIRSPAPAPVVPHCDAEVGFDWNG